MKRTGGRMLAGIGIMLAGMAADTVLAQGVRAVPGTVAPGAVVPGAVIPGAVVPGAVAPAAGDKKILLIRRLSKLNKVKQPTPQYTATGSRTFPGRPHEWAVFEVTYDTLPAWMDEVVVTYYLIADRRGTDAKKEFTFYQTTVRYADVARGEHTACVVLPPSALLRNGDQFVGFAVEISSADGTLLAAKDEKEGSVLPADWWKKPEVTESKNVVKRDGLVDRSKTPFGLINIDEYEAVK